MRKNWILIFALCTAIVVAFTAVAAAKWDVFKAGNLTLRADGGVLPEKLPRKQFAPAADTLAGEISTADGTHPPALRRAVIDFDKNNLVNIFGVPVCGIGKIKARDTAAAKRACGHAIVGTGSATAEVAFDEQAPFRVKSPILVFNGGVKGHAAVLFIHAYISAPISTAVVSTVKLTRIHEGRYGMQAVVQIPAIAGGAGSLVDFNLKINRIFKYKGKMSSFVVARCPDGRFDTKVVGAEFKDEVGSGGSGSMLSGTVVRSCTPMG